MPDSFAAPRYYQAIIKVNQTDTPERQASDIADGTAELRVGPTASGC